MANGGIRVKKVATILDEVDRLHQAISRRAYELFRNGSTRWSGALNDWLAAERELVSKPPIELRQEGTRFEVLAVLPGVEPQDLNVRMTPQDVLIRAENGHVHTAAAGTVHLCEFDPGKVFRSIRFPETVDPGTATAEYRNGILRVTAALAAAGNADTACQPPASGACCG